MLISHSHGLDLQHWVSFHTKTHAFPLAGLQAFLLMEISFFMAKTSSLCQFIISKPSCLLASTKIPFVILTPNNKSWNYSTDKCQRFYIAYYPNFIV